MNRRISLGMILIMALLTLPGCSLLRIWSPFSYSVKVVNSSGGPVKGALVQASNGERARTNKNGYAHLQFGVAGVYVVKISHEDGAPQQFTITMPTQAWGEKKVSLLEPVQYQASFQMAQPTAMMPMLMSSLFSAHGFDLSLTPYEPGEWTRWSLDYNGDEIIAERGFLQETGEGQWWWMKVESSGGEPIHMEILFDQQRKSIKRIRQKIGDNPPQEQPVQQGFYQAPAQITQESLEAAIEARGEQLTVADQSFSTDRIEYGLSPQVNLHLWRAEEVPGGLAQYRVLSDGEQQYTARLLDYGTGKTESQLDSF